MDVGPKGEIHARMPNCGNGRQPQIRRDPEILGMSDRIAVMHAGTIRKVLPREEATQSGVLALALNASPDGGEAVRGSS